MGTKIDIKSMNLSELEEYITSLGQPNYRAKQIFRWMHQGAVSFEEMSNLPEPLRRRLAEDCKITVPQVEKKQISILDGTIKYLWRLEDGNCVETVLLRYRYGNTVCVSSQVGCQMGCAFCASTLGGLMRNLTPSEILNQVLFTSLNSGLPISNIVLMGIGEPLDNLEAVLRFLELINQKDGMNIGMRHISLSTCGLVDRIYDLAKHKFQLTLSVSLHAPNDEIRRKTMPVSQKYSMEELLNACQFYEKATGRRISFEYAMIQDVNDSDDCARELAQKLEGTLCHVNLIPVNHVAGVAYRKSSVERQKKFIQILERHGIVATVRRTLGSDINASCGQLRRRKQEQEEVSHV